MTARFFVDLPLVPGTVVSLPAHAARHVQVLRLQPGDRIAVFNGQGHQTSPEGEFEATVSRMGRNDVDVTVGDYTATRREAPRAVHLAVGMPANERMDWLIEKATELGVASIQPLMSERSVLRVKADRADKKRAHWHGIAVAACEQCGRSRVPVIHEVATFGDWLKNSLPADPGSTPVLRALLSLHPASRPLADAAAGAGELVFLSGPEGGLSPAEEAAALARGFAPVTLGPRVLRAETAPLACLSWAALMPPC